MTGTVTHFEIYGPVPETLVEFYQKVFGWQVEEMPGLNYWRIQTGATETKPLHGGLTYSAIPNLNGWLALRQRRLARRNGGQAPGTRRFDYAPENRRSKNRVGDDCRQPRKKYFGVWQTDSNAFPMPDPD